ncbi:MAG: potassium transporter TrkG [Pseudomonadota bacterium]
MTAKLLALPLVVLVMGIGALAMFLPAIYASITDDHATARAFFYSGVLFLVLFSMVAVATSSLPVRRQGRGHLISILATFLIIPAMLAVPFAEVVRDTRFVSAYFEMVSSLTTTGATLFPPDRLPPALHLWRAQVGWLGGFFVWVTAVAILAPMNLGGFEVRGATAQIGRGATERGSVTSVADFSNRLARYAVMLLPIYLGLTLTLWALLYMAGDSALTALCHAMSVISTSGISPEAGLASAEGGSGVAGEAIMAIFLLFALSRVTFAAEERPHGWRSLRDDGELRIGLLFVCVLPTLMALRHWIGAIELRTEDEFSALFETLWGAAFTTVSFLTTTGFESVYWDTARGWSGLQAPGLILMGLAVFGGGVATTAGGVKLLRVYALYKHGLRELEKLVQPNSIGGSGIMERRIRRQGAYVAWVFFMLFAISIAGFMLLFALTGIDFDAVMVLTIAGLTTTGPLTGAVATAPVDLAQIGDGARAVFAAAMVVGRLETLAIIALLNPDFWRG